MKYLSVCSGIEAATVAWHPLGWQPVGFAEIELFPAAVLAHHYPEVPNFGDMTRYKEWNVGTVELLVGGTPCQSFSVAGLRKGLADPRGNLALVYCGILDQLRPEWFVWENVPGVLSSNGGRDFGSFLGALAELGYGFAYRVLDAQYFGVAQRRRRVFVVGYLGDWRPAAEVLFERESVHGNPAPSREKGKEVAGATCAGAYLGNAEGGALDVPFMTASSQMRCANNQTPLVAQPISWDEELNTSVNVAGTLLRGGAGGRHDGVAQPITFGAQMSTPQTDVDLVQTLQAKNPMAVAQPIAFAQNQRDEVRELAVAGALAAEPGMKQQTYIAFNARQDPDSWQERTGPLDAHGSTQAVGVTIHGTDGTARVASFTETSSALRSRIPSGVENSTTTAVMHSMAVRRLTPVECERLQGFPDNYTNIPWRKQPDSPDGPRYKALGNSMAVPVMAWIGRRIMMYRIQQEGMAA